MCAQCDPHLVMDNRTNHGDLRATGEGGKMDIKALEKEAEHRRQVYAKEMDIVAQFARADCDLVRKGIAPDGLAGTVLERALGTYYRWVQADKAVSRARAGR